MRFLNFWDSLSLGAGGVGTFGRLRSDEYEGGVVTDECDVDGRDDGEAAAARRLADEAVSRGCGVPCRDRALNSVSRLSRNNCSN